MLIVTLSLRLTLSLRKRYGPCIYDYEIPDLDQPIPANERGLGPSGRLQPFAPPPISAEQVIGRTVEEICPYVGSYGSRSTDLRPLADGPTLDVAQPPQSLPKRLKELGSCGATDGDPSDAGHPYRLLRDCRDWACSHATK